MKKKILLPLLAVGAIAITTPTIATLVSCAQDKSNLIKSDNPLVKQLYNEYLQKFNEALGTKKYFQLTAENQPKVLKVINEYIIKINDLLKQDQDNQILLDTNGQIWLESFKFDLEVKKELYESNIRYLIIDDYDSFILTPYHSTFNNQIINVADKLNPKFVSDITNDVNGYTNVVITQLTDLKVYIEEVNANLKEGLENKVTFSGVETKHIIGKMLQQLYYENLQKFVDANGANGDYTKKGFLFTITTQNQTAYKKSTNYNKLQQLANETQIAIDTLMNFLVNEYYPKVEYGRSDVAQSKLTFQISDALTDVEDNGFFYKDKYINGLGLNNADLETKDIGIGFSGKQGQKIYLALLKKHSNLDDSPVIQLARGKKGVEEILNNMKHVANTVADIMAGPNQAWSATGEFYDSDSSGNDFAAIPADLALQHIRNNGQIDLSKFFIWLNTNRWFNGRDMKENQYPAIDGKVINSEYQLIDSSSKPTPINPEGKQPYNYIPKFESKTDGISSVNIGDVIGAPGSNSNDLVIKGDAGNLYYKYLKLGLSPSTIQTSNQITKQSNSITPEAAYVGASRAVYQYLNFKEATAEHLTSAFIPTNFNYTLRTGTGGAAYANGGPGMANIVADGWGGFYLDVNPYFGLQKWSMSTLAVHEGITGHVFQYNYAADHPVSQDAISFSSTAYGEGWGLFSEWLAVQMGVYGEPAKITSADSNGNDLLQLPKFGTNSKGLNVTGFDKTFANGAYYVDDDKSTPEEGDAGNNQKFYDAMQYFGFLNERQLRAMRVVVDIGLHAGKNGDFTPGSGMTLKQARDYMSSNSGLGIDDIKRESKRYLEYTGQATSYYNGLIFMQNAYLKAKAKYEANNPGKPFLDWANPTNTVENTGGLFDIMLRNNDVPLSVLEKYTDFYIYTHYENELQ